MYGTRGRPSTAPIENAAVITPNNAPFGVWKSGLLATATCSRCLLTVLPRLYCLKPIQDTTIIARRHFNTQRGGYQEHVESSKVLLSIPWRGILLKKMTDLRDLCDISRRNIMSRQRLRHCDQRGQLELQYTITVQGSRDDLRSRAIESGQDGHQAGLKYCQPQY